MNTHDEHEPQERWPRDSLSPFIDEGGRPGEPDGAVSEKQLSANRQNAQHSTGPRTPEGKARSAMNAVKHGLCTNRPIIPGEDPREFDHCRTQFLNDLRATDAVERAIGERVCLLTWRLRRVTRYETSLVRRSLLIVEKDLNQYRKFRSEKEFRQDYPEADDPQALMDKAVVISLATPAFQTLMRYEAQVERSLFKALSELRQLWKTGLNHKLLSRRPSTWEPPMDDNQVWWEYPDEAFRPQPQRQPAPPELAELMDQRYGPEWRNYGMTQNAGDEPQEEPRDTERTHFADEAVAETVTCVRDSDSDPDDTCPHEDTPGEAAGGADGAREASAETGPGVEEPDETNPFCDAPTPT